MAILVEEARKLTFGAKIRVHTPHAVRTILSQKSGRWMTDSQILKYETILIEMDELSITTNSYVDPSQFLYGQNAIENEEVKHNCLDIIDYQTKIQEDLMDIPIEGGVHLFMDGSSRVVEGKWKSGYAVIDGEDLTVVESGTVFQLVAIANDHCSECYQNAYYETGVITTFMAYEYVNKVYDEKVLETCTAGMQMIDMPMDPKAAVTGGPGTQKIMVLHSVPKQTKDTRISQNLLLEWELSKKTENMDKAMDVLVTW
ncbi:hypothetical protein BTVI_58271 [Pitangus sulphuratus]|nr:hypothetical protein BTVI_58271 [Pitangus sulphuratus]